MRWIAKNIVAAGLAKRCELQVAYAIGAAKPVGLYAETFGTENISVPKIVDTINRVFDLRPAAIIQDLNLLEPVFRMTSSYGHFGRNGFTWEEVNRTGVLRDFV
jgi:S-adenosylmethionine synthase 1